MYQYEPINALRSKNSELIFMTFDSVPQSNDRFFLPQNIELDSSKIVGIQFHYNATVIGLGTYELPPTMKIGSQTYNTITYIELGLITLTVVNDKRRQTLSQIPARSLAEVPANFNFGGHTPTAKRYKKLDTTILTGESFITWNLGAVFAAPLIIPIEFFYE